MRVGVVELVEVDLDRVDLEARELRIAGATPSCRRVELGEEHLHLRGDTGGGRGEGNGRDAVHHIHDAGQGAALRERVRGISPRVDDEDYELLDLSRIERV